MSDEDVRDEGPWVPAPLQSILRAGLSARELRDFERDRRLHEHVSRRRERGEAPPRRVRGLSQEDIVAAAMTVADAEGVGAVSMRRIARELGAGAMSLYWYVASKEELQDLMLEQVEAEIEAPEPSGDWRGDLRTFARNARVALLRHQWAVELMAVRPPAGPNDAHNADRLFGVFDGLELDMLTMVRLALTFATYITGAVRQEIREIQSERETAEAMANLSAEELEAARDEFVRRIRDSGKYPRLARLMEADIDPDDPATRDERFEFGLEVVLDGLAARLPARG
jgi:AcrR family transcriptional regulator